MSTNTKQQLFFFLFCDWLFRYHFTIMKVFILNIKIDLGRQNVKEYICNKNKIQTKNTLYIYILLHFFFNEIDKK